MNNNEPILIYNFNEHGLYYKPDYAYSYEILIFTMGTVQLEFNHNTEELLAVTGYLPLISADRKAISIPSYDDDKFIVSMKDIFYQQGMAYDYFDFFPISREYFMINEYNPKLVYDKNNKRIQIGTADKNDEYIRINKNTICGLDKDKNLKSLLILIDVIIKPD